MVDIAFDREIKTCCATFYQSDIVRILLGDVFHPGGLELTHHLGTILDLQEAASCLASNWPSGWANWALAILTWTRVSVWPVASSNRSRIVPWDTR